MTLTQKKAIQRQEGKTLRPRQQDLKHSQTQFYSGLINLGAYWRESLRSTPELDSAKIGGFSLSSEYKFCLPFTVQVISKTKP